MAMGQNIGQNIDTELIMKLPQGEVRVKGFVQEFDQHQENPSIITLNVKIVAQSKDVVYTHPASDTSIPTIPTIDKKWNCGICALRGAPCKKHGGK